MSLMALGTLDPLLVTAYTGFDIDQSKQRIPILGSLTSYGNEVIQQGPTPYRQASVSFVAETTDAEIVQGYYEDGTEVTHTDDESNDRTVLVYDFSRSQIIDGLWSITVVLLELEPFGS